MSSSSEAVPNAGYHDGLWPISSPDQDGLKSVFVGVVIGLGVPGLLFVANRFAGIGAWHWELYSTVFVDGLVRPTDF